MELGVNWVDTAAVYGLGHSEEVVGRALRSHRTGEEVFVFTKCGRRWEGRPEGVIGNDLRPESIREECERQPASPRPGAHRPLPGALARLDDRDAARRGLGDDGRARGRGQGTLDRSLQLRRRTARPLRGGPPRRRGAAAFSLLARGALATVVPWAAAHGAGVLGYSPLASGMLTGAYDRERIAAPRRGRLAPCRPRVQRAAALPEPGARRAARRDRGTARSDAPRACRRLGAGAAGRHREYRRDAPAGTRRRLGGRRRPRAGRPSAPRDQRGDHRHRGWVGRAACPAAAHQARPRIEPEPRSPVMRLGLLSTANINRAILAGAADTDRVEVVAVASRDEARARSYAAEHGIPSAHGSYEALLADPGGRCRLHLAPERDAPRVDDAGARRRQARALREAVHPPPRRGRGGVRRRRRPPGSCSRRRSCTATTRRRRRCARLVADGAVGRLCAVKTTFSFPLRDLSDVRALPELDGGALMDVGCYCVSGIRLLAGDPEHVRGEQVTGPTGIDMAFHGTLRCADDVVGQFEASFRSPQRQRSRRSARTGCSWSRRRGASTGRIADADRRRRRPRSSRSRSADSYTLELENLADAIDGRAPALLGREDAVGQARTIDALYRSAESRAAVTLDPA